VNLPQDKNISLQIQMDFKRDAPTTATDISKVFSKALNYSIYPDCVTGLQLKYFSQSREICEQDE